MSDRASLLPVAIIGAGPVGLAAAAQLALRDMPFVVLEASHGVAASFASTAHVKLFSNWKMNIDPGAVRLLESSGWTPPDPALFPTAGEMRGRYLEPLAALLEDSVRFGAHVASISRQRFDKVRTVGRDRAPFVLRVRTQAAEEDLLARAVIDASGTWSNPNWMGANGTPAIGERELAARIRYGMPDILGAERARYAGKRVMVVGAGHSAAGNLVALAELAAVAPGTGLIWALRGSDVTRAFGGAEKDGLPERGQLGVKLRALTGAGLLDVVTGLHIERVFQRGDKLTVAGSAGGAERQIDGIDEIIVATGARPDLSLARELRLKLDAWLESTEALAPLIDPNVHSCGSVPPHGHRELAHPEPGFYAVGAKSYGRAPNFLLATGYEQVRSVVAALAGDIAAANTVELSLPETGVCSLDFGEKRDGCGAPSEPAAPGACCPAPAPALNSGCRS
jgi:hypothetical protein